MNFVIPTYFVRPPTLLSLPYYHHPHPPTWNLYLLFEEEVVFTKPLKSFRQLFPIGHDIAHVASECEGRLE